MRTKTLKSRHEERLSKAGRETSKEILERANYLFDQIRIHYPQITLVETGMGTGSFRGHNVPVVWDDDSEGFLGGGEIYEWGDCFLNHTRKVYNPKGITPKIQALIVELVEICEWVSQDNTIPDLYIERQ